MKRPSFRQAAALSLTLLVVLGAAYLLKRHYSEAGADELGWILRPTAALVALATGRTFTSVSGAGFLNRETDILIAPACAGVNFLIVEFLALASLVTRHGDASARARWLALAAGLAYAATIVVNAVRISLWIWLRPLLASAFGSELEEWHRAVGVVVYLVALFLSYAVAERALASIRGSRPFGRASLFATPLVLYLGITLGVPLLNGAGSSAYYDHALRVLGLSLGLVIAAIALASFTLRFRLARSGHQSRSRC